MIALLLIALAYAILWGMLERDRRVGAERRAATLVKMLRRWGFDITLHDNGVSVIHWDNDDDSGWRA